MNKLKIIKVIRNRPKGRVYFKAFWKGKRKSWNVSRGLFEVIEELQGVFKPSLNQREVEEI